MDEEMGRDNAQRKILFILAALIFGFFVLAVVMTIKTNATNAELSKLKHEVGELSANIENLKTKVEKLNR